MKTLTEVLAEHRYDHLGYVCGCGVECGIKCDNLTYAAHVAAAYREARTIRTREALNALPHDPTQCEGAVVKDARGDIFERSDTGWGEPGADGVYPDPVVLPAFVLWTPGDTP